MKLCITARDFSLAPGNAYSDLRSAGFEIVDFSERRFSSASSAEEIAAAFGDAECALVGLEPIGETVLSLCPRLRFLSRRSVGCDTLNLDACRHHGVGVAVAAGTVAEAVAEHVMAGILYFARELHLQSAELHAACWHRTLVPGAKGHTVGTVGFGGIGKEVARRANAFGMRTLYCARHRDEPSEALYSAEYRPLNRLLCESDYLVLALPLTNETENLIDRAALSLMKPDAVLINVARSRIVDTCALADALSSGRLRGALVDVFDKEPCTSSPLHALDNCILTPHTAVFTTENQELMNECAAKNCIDFKNGFFDPKYRIL